MPTDPPPFHVQVATAIASHRELDVAMYGPKGSGRPELEMSPEAAMELGLSLGTFCCCRVRVTALMKGQHVKIVTRRWQAGRW